jgi:hypothetical protein
MVIYVNEMPTRPDDCLFARKEVDAVLRDIETYKPTYVYTYYCNVNHKRCDLFCNGQCDKLHKPFGL